ncbi:M16 family metallopeptidase [Pinirhizobacter sp.]|uniref:M16 family metallopeptidase n=1 Tax=Pinirhizobacter sp. TaxID=2950432 RepID=UPI002F407ED0
MIAPDRARGMPGGAQRSIDVPVFGAMKHELQELEQKLSGRALKTSELIKLITSGFGRTPMGQAMAQRLAVDFVKSALPDHVPSGEREVWESIVEDAMRMPFSQWREMHANTPALSCPKASPATLKKLRDLLLGRAPADMTWSDAFPNQKVSERIADLLDMSRRVSLETPTPVRNGSGNGWIAAVIGALGVGRLPGAQAATGFGGGGTGSVHVPLLPQRLVNIATPVMSYLAPVASFASQHPRALSTALAGAALIATSATMYELSGSPQDQEISLPPSGPVNFPPVLRRELPNGLPVVFAPMGDGNDARLVFVFDGGRMGDLDPDTRLGVANLALHVLKQRAGKLEGSALDRRLDELGLSVTARATEGYSTIVLAGLEANLVEGTQIVVDMLTDNHFPDELLSQSRARALINIDRLRTNLALRSSALMDTLILGEQHPYGRDPAGEGTRASLAAITGDHLTRWASRCLDWSKATIIAIGPIDVGTLSTGLVQAFGTVDGARERGRADVPVLTQSVHPGMHVLTVDGGDQSEVMLGYPVPRDGSTNDVLSTCIDQIIQRRVKRALREQQGVTYGLRSLATQTRGVRIGGFASSVENSRALDALEEAREVVSGLVEGREPVTQEELDLHAQGYRRALATRFEDPAEVQSVLVAGVDRQIADMDMEQTALVMDALTSADVNAALGNMSMGHLTWVLAGPAAGGENPATTPDPDWQMSESDEGQRADAELRLRLTAMGLSQFTTIDPMTGARTVHRL